jgi:prepilin-type N-terminal cleavage/methylation domain-containing protein
MMTPTSAFKARQAKTQHPSQAGFTLLEILLVLTIIGMASILVVPNITNLESRNFDAQIRQANSLLNYARRIAVVKGQPAVASFIINSDENGDSIADRGRNRSSRGSEQRLDPSFNRRITPVGEWHSEGIQIRYRDSSDREVEVEERINITFYPEGGSTGGTLFISLADASDDESIAIEIDPFTGRINTISPDN